MENVSLHVTMHDTVKKKEKISLLSFITLKMKQTVVMGLRATHRGLDYLSHTDARTQRGGAALTNKAKRDLSC